MTELLEKQMSSDLRNIPINQVRENVVALRGVDRVSEKYVGLRDAIGRNGILCAISVREKVDAETGETYFEICDGLQRFSCAVDLKMEDVPAQVLTLDDAETYEAQIVANLHRVDTKHAQFAKQLQRMLSLNPTLTIPEFADRLAVSPAWIHQRMNLLKLREDIQSLVDEGKVNVSNAVALSKLPEDEQVNFLDRAMTMTPGEFNPTVATRVKELNENLKKGKASTVSEFVPVAHMRKIGELKAELETSANGPAIVAKANAGTPAEGFALGIRYSLSLDPDTVQVKQAEYDARILKQQEAKKKREAERAEKKAQEAAEVSAKLNEEISV